MAKIKNERLFVELSPLKARRKKRGRDQFFAHQSLGVKPEKPVAYYNVLTEGKKQVDFLSTEYLKMYLSGEWWGFLMLWKDWVGKRWVLPYLCKWYPKITDESLPLWLDKEVPRYLVPGG